ncbi:MAG: hypothetical protein ABS79_02765 [Planctomycetes bacterium SCN 63-9]|nr:MAG: hypothetical protein ABS79_02765 [Planctomycetes bacterium SCN 63-9]
MIEAPVNIRAHQGEQILEVVWSEDRIDRTPYRQLRAECPCASCKDEWTGARILDPSTIRADLKLDGMEMVGNYAVRLGWNDGHSSGLYTWETLSRIGSGLPSSE